MASFKDQLKQDKKFCVKRLLTMYKHANAGHIGASLSCLELLIYLNRISSPKDTILLSKGHAAGALYVTLEYFGKVPEGTCLTFYQDGTQVAAHPPCNKNFDSIPFGTGSLGHGVGLGVGIALAARLKNSGKKVFVIASDGELNEGSVWESIMFASHHRLSNFVLIIDKNGLQGLGKTDSIMNMEPLNKKFIDFGFNTVIAEKGNEFESIDQAYRAVENSKTSSVIIANTTKGNGVSFMENKFEWHYLPMTDEQYQVAMAEVESKNA